MDNNCDKCIETINKLKIKYLKNKIELQENIIALLLLITCLIILSFILFMLLKN